MECGRAEALERLHRKLLRISELQTSQPGEGRGGRQAEGLARPCGADKRMRSQEVI